MACLTADKQLEYFMVPPISVSGEPLETCLYWLLNIHLIQALSVACFIHELALASRLVMTAFLKLVASQEAAPCKCCQLYILSVVM